jgi:hypothetical protein
LFVLLSVWAAINRSTNLLCVILRIFGCSVHSNLASVAVGVGQNKRPQWPIFRHRQPFDSADKTAASIALLGCFGLSAILAPNN